MQKKSSVIIAVTDSQKNYMKADLGFSVSTVMNLYMKTPFPPHAL
jgi:hypothetical protein